MPTFDTTWSWTAALPVGTADDACCPLCGTPAEISRAQRRPASFAEAMAHRHGRSMPERDHVRCPHDTDEWHIAAGALHERLRHLDGLTRGQLAADLRGVLFATRNTP